MKQKILVKVSMHCDKCRTKALKIAAAAHGVSKVSIEGADKDHIEVIGDGVDSVCLTRLLRKKLCFAIIVKVEEVKEAKPDTKVVKPTPPVQCISSASYCAPQCPSMCISSASYCAPQCPSMYYRVCEYPEPNNCSIM